jgi:hypothetical protein
VAGSAGTDTSLPLTNSAVTVTGRGAFSNLKITLNQTKNLTNQAISITWTGGTPTVNAVGNNTVYGGDFLQIFQCWGDDDGSNPANPGPPSDKCEFGGFLGLAPTQVHGGKSLPIGDTRALDRIIGAKGGSTYDPTQGFTDNNGVLWKPFKSVDGSVFNTQYNILGGNPFNPNSGPYWLNTAYNYYDTNEDPLALTHGDGSGAELFTAATGLEAPGLGCGQKLEPFAGSLRIPKCWLTIVPRGSATDENPPDLGNTQAVATSPLAPAAWNNRIVVPLEFNPVDSPCNIAANARRIAGSELASPAVSSWQPTLCSAPGAPPYDYAPISDSQARQQVANGTAGAAGMAVTSRPIDPSSVDPANPVVYAPLTLSGITIGFNIERTPLMGGTGPVDPAEGPLQAIRVAHINLTPRLVAKLLSESYRSQYYPTPTGSAYGWRSNNPDDVVEDPDFLQYNPEFKNLRLPNRRTLSGPIVELQTSDAAYEVWRWVLADPEAKTWLDGTADPWGMNVNPFYSTNANLNPSHASFAVPAPPDGYPKSDPYCDQDPATPLGLPPTMCMTSYTPYANTMQITARDARIADDGAKTIPDPNQPTLAQYWQADGPQLLGQRSLLAITDTAWAARYGLQTASLSRAGDDTASRSFVAPDQPAALIAGQRGMVPSQVPEVLQTNPATSDPSAYPLTMLTYAATTPRSLDTAARSDYASFVTYAAGPGQTPGVQPGQLPPGYAPLPADLRAQATVAAQLIQTGDPAPPASSTASPGDTAGTQAGGGGSQQQSGVSGSNLANGTGSAGADATTGTGPGGGISGPGSGATGTGSAPVLASRRPKVKLTPVGSSSRTPGDVLGFIRYALPIAVAVGLVAMLGARFTGRRRKPTELGAELVETT